MCCGGAGTTGNFLNSLVKTVAPSLGILDKLPIGETVRNVVGSASSKKDNEPKNTDSSEKSDEFEDKE